MTKTVTWKLWCVTKRLPSSRTGIRCPRPGLERSAACGFELIIDLIENRQKNRGNEGCDDCLAYEEIKLNSWA